MGFRKRPLKRRALVALLVHNGFAPKRQSGTSHQRYEGIVDGRTSLVDVDESIDEFGPDSYGALYFIVTSQLRFGTGTAAWQRNYAGHPDTAKQHGLPYEPWTPAKKD